MDGLSKPSLKTRTVLLKPSVIIKLQTVFKTVCKNILTVFSKPSSPDNLKLEEEKNPSYVFSLPFPLKLSVVPLHEVLL
jgi:hypothetical protein